MSVLTVSTHDFLADVQRYMQHISDGLGIIVEPINKARQKAVAKHDDTLMTKEEFYAKLDRAEEQVRQGKVYTKNPDETFEDFFERISQERHVHS